tara:strand:+ start:68 stop:1471 length:1404 start_codon:yes stop_codon:yes gene_type:complete
MICFSKSILAQYQIGHYTTIFQDPDRLNREIETKIYYPAEIVEDTILIAQGQFPVIVFGHGFLMDWSSYQNLWEKFVPNGYIMVFPTTERGLLSTDHQQFGWDLQFLVNQIQNEGFNSNSPIYNSVGNNTALMGHSMGGGAVFLAADSLCNNGNNQLKTIVGLAPTESSTNGVSSIESALNITVPSLILSGTQDGVTPPTNHHIPMYNNLSSDCKTFISIFGGGHCYFANPNIYCDIGESTASSGISISRTEQQDITFDFLNLWLDYTLKSDCNEFYVFQDSLSVSNKITYDQSCSQNPIANIIQNEDLLISSVIAVEYQWYLNNTNIPNANEFAYSPTINGEYNVEVFFTSGCPTFSNPYNFINELDIIVKLMPNEYTISQNYPNPFNPFTTLEYGLPEDSYVDITVYDMLGNVVINLVNENQSIGFKSVQWNATNYRGQPVSAGVYLYSIQAGQFSQTKKMVLLK